jgi:hypothetical protein
MHAIALVESLKRMLKGRATTYARVAAGLGLSEASVKRMFSRRDLTLQRLRTSAALRGLFFLTNRGSGLYSRAVPKCFDKKID